MTKQPIKAKGRIKTIYVYRISLIKNYKLEGYEWCENTAHLKAVVAQLVDDGYREKDLHMVKLPIRFTKGGIARFLYLYAGHPDFTIGTRPGGPLAND